MTKPVDIVDFWMLHGPEKWFVRDAAFDAEIAARFAETHLSAARLELRDWARTAEGALALLLLLDQFPRNLYRGSAHAYATDGLARAIAGRAIRAGFDRSVDPSLRPFFYLPFEHSENLADQHVCVTLCQGHHDDNGAVDILEYAELHRDIILRFGRFPHRNVVLGRETTAEEQTFLDEGGFKG